MEHSELEFSAEHILLIVLQDEVQDLRHLAITARMVEKMALQPPERFGQVGERRAVVQGPGLALVHRVIVPPVTDSSAWQVVGALDDPGMLTNNLAFRGDDYPLWIDPDAHRPIAGGGGTL